MYVNRLNTSIKGHKWQTGLKTGAHNILSTRDPHIKEMDILIHRLKVRMEKSDKRDGKRYHAKGNDKKLGIGILL